MVATFLGQTMQSEVHQFFQSSDSICYLNSKNSGGSFKTAVGYNKNNWITNFRYQLLYFQNGLPGHTHDSVWEAF